MQLWIRNETELIKVENEVYYTLFKDGHALFSNEVPLGVYKTKERALEILDEIEEYLMGKGLEKQTTMNCVYPMILYKMPKE